MNRPLSLLLGVVATVLFSLMGLVVVPSWQIGGLAPRSITNGEGVQVTYPEALAGDAALGRRTYQAEGCIYCHSQQVLPEGFGVDIERNYGSRRSVPLDYVYNAPPLLGTMRTGPDLSNIATRQPSATWHHLHLYDARLVSPGSIMPPLRYLYSVVRQDPGTAGHGLPDDYFGYPAWIVPSPEAHALVAYLEALHQDHELEQVK